MIWITAVEASLFSTYCCCLHFLPASKTVSHLRNIEIRDNKMATTRNLTTKPKGRMRSATSLYTKPFPDITVIIEVALKVFSVRATKAPRG